jgi:hypothetical protein
METGDLTPQVIMWLRRELAVSAVQVGGDP